MLPRFVRAPNPIWYMVDLVGRSLNDEYYAFFLTNTIPYMPQVVYQDINGLFPWPFPLQFQPSGTLPNNLYFPSEPGTVYRIEIRHGNTQTDPLIWEINDFIPFPGGESPDSQSIDTDNLITNPQFQYINFTSPLTITSAGTYNIAPGWDLIVTGLGVSVVLTQLILTADQQRNSNPAYALQINSSGFSTVQLRQRFNNNGGLFANNAVTMSALLKANDSIAWPVSLEYAPSALLANKQTVAAGQITINSFQPLANAIKINPSSNNQPSDIAFIDMLINLPANSNISISNIQMIGQDVPVTLSYEQTSNERQTDFLFHYYADELIIKPKKSILTGWNFAQNPSQFRAKSGGTVVTQTEYIADQTILHQENNSQIQAFFAGAANSQKLVITPVDLALTTRFALIQYVDATTILPYWGYYLSSLVRSLLVTSHSSNIKIKMRLIYKNSPGRPAVLSNTNPILSWASTDPVFDVDWTQIVPLNDPSYTLLTTANLDEGVNAFPHYSFDSFSIPVAANLGQTLGIVLYTTDNMNSTIGSKDQIIFDRISLVPNLFAVDSHPITYDQTLRECEFYYEKSYARDVMPETSSAFGNQLTDEMLASSAFVNAFPKQFTVKFKNIKTTHTPTVLLYAPSSGEINKVDLYYQIDAGPPGVFPTTTAFWTSYALDDYANSYRPVNTSTPIPPVVPLSVHPDAWIAYHYTSDARLGLV